MKKNKDLIYKCEECGFVTNENNKVCVLCGKKTINVNQKKRLYFNSLPPFLEQKQDTCLVYYCKRCNEVEKTKVCLLNNTINSLALRYQKRLILLETIKHLNEVFTNEEIKRKHVEALENKLFDCELSVFKTFILLEEPIEKLIWKPVADSGHKNRQLLFD